MIIGISIGVCVLLCIISVATVMISKKKRPEVDESKPNIEKGNRYPTRVLH